MAHVPDLSPCSYLPVSGDTFLAVGWLAKGFDFASGTTPPEVFARLCIFARAPWQPFVTAGIHSCDLCQFDGEQRGKANLFIPYSGNIYVCPELITHYINAHLYLPPPVFCDAVMACPPMDSMQYKRLLISCKGQSLWQVPAT